jgi:hypothetical protein
VIYIDDTAVVFSSRKNEMIKALPLAQKQFSDLGMEMYVGKHFIDPATGLPKIKESKIECRKSKSPKLSACSSRLASTSSELPESQIQQ